MEMSGHSRARPLLAFASQSAICSKERSSWGKCVFTGSSYSPYTTLATFSFLSICIWAKFKRDEGKKRRFCQILQEGCDIWTFLLSFFHFPLSHPLPSGVCLSGYPVQSNLNGQNFLPLSCYQRVFGLRVHTCPMNALTNVWLFEERLCDGT